MLLKAFLLKRHSVGHAYNVAFKLHPEIVWSCDCVIGAVIWLRKEC